MTLQVYALTPGRIEKFKGQMLGRAAPQEVLCRGGRQVRMPKNNSKTYIARSFLPYGATTTNANTINRFFQDGTGDRTLAILAANLTAEAVTSTPDSIVPRDVTVVIQQYNCLYGFSDQTFDLYEDDIPKAAISICADRTTFVNEMICYGALKSCTNAYFGGTGTTRATVNGGITLNLIRRIAQNLMLNHGKMVNKQLSASGDFGTDAVAAGFTVYCSTDLEPDIRDLPGFIPVEKYASGTPMQYEIGKCERFRFVTTPDLPSIQDAGAAVGATGLYSTTSTNIDVYQFIVTAADAWSQIAVRGADSSFSSTPASIAAFATAR